MTTPPTWTRDPAGWAYTLHSGDNRCRVWRTSHDRWAAVISQRDASTAASNFQTVEEAKAWCEKRIAEQKAGRND